MVMRLLLCTLVVLCLVDISRVMAGRFIVHTKAGKSFLLDTEAGAREGQSGEDYRLGRYSLGQSSHCSLVQEKLSQTKVYSKEIRRPTKGLSLCIQDSQ